jgi:multidrug efflux pump
MVISLTTTPMMCAYLLKDEGERNPIKHGRACTGSARRDSTWMLSGIQPEPAWVLEHPGPC